MFFSLLISLFPFFLGGTPRGDGPDGDTISRSSRVGTAAGYLQDSFPPFLVPACLPGAEQQSCDQNLPGGSPQKGINKANKEIFPNLSENVRGLKLRFLALSEGPGGFRKLREAGRNHFHLSWYLSVPGRTSYDQKPWGGTFSFVAGILYTNLDLKGEGTGGAPPPRPLYPPFKYQMFVYEFLYEFSEKVPGCLPVAGKRIQNLLKFDFSENLIISPKKNSLPFSLTRKFDGWRFRTGSSRLDCLWYISEHSSTKNVLTSRHGHGLGVIRF